MYSPRLNAAIVAIFCGALQTSLLADEAWDNPADIPETGPVSVGLAGEKPADVVRYLLAEGASTASLSPDGETVAFRWAVSGEPQLWTVSATGGFPRQITFGSAISMYRWTPDGTGFLLSRDANGNEREGYYLLSRDGTEEREILPQSAAYRNFGDFSPDGDRFVYSSTERNGRDFDIYVADLEGHSELVYEGSFGYYTTAWQPGGDNVIVTEVRGEDARDVHMLDVRSGRLTTLFEPEVAASFSNFEWLPDGSGFFVSTNLDREYQGLAKYSLEDGSLEFLETPDSDVGNINLGSDGRFLTWTTNEDGYSKLHAMNTQNGEKLPVPALDPGVYSVDVAAGTTNVAVVRISGPATPGDVVVWDIADGSASTAVTASLGGLDPDSFVTPASLRYPARDGIELQGLLYLPDEDTHPRPPVLVQVHGGPTGQSRPSFRAIEQYLVNQGVAVFAVNVRGSTGFGKTYTRLDNQEKRLDSVRDLVDTVAFLSDDPRLDTGRIAVMGGSYGGYMVNAVLGSYPGVFDAGVSMVGVSDWVRALREASPGLKASDRIEYGDIREERWQRFYAENSPINNADKINVPMLVSHGANDPRDPVTESDRIVKAVRANGQDVIYMRWPDEGHSIRKRPNRVAFYRTLSTFLEQQLKPANLDLGD